MGKYRFVYNVQCFHESYVLFTSPAEGEPPQGGICHHAAITSADDEAAEVFEFLRVPLCCASARSRRPGMRRSWA